MGHIVVIGAGQAGASLVGKLRTQGYDGDITLLGAEDGPPYQRPALSKAYLLGEMERDRLYLRPRDWYAGNDIALRTGTRAVSVDTTAQTVTVEGDEVLTYDHLALTTGSHPRLLPDAVGGNLDGVYQVRDLADADAMMPEFVEGRRLLIIGGGYIGLEAAAVAAKMGLHVVLVEMAERILQRVAAPQTSDYFRDLHRAHGVDIREGVGLDTLTGEGRVSGAVLTDGTTLDIDFAIVGVGIYPATVLAEAAGIACDNGIQTDVYGQTSAANVWAAGDCATLEWHGQQIRLESVGNAIDQAECVARNMLGAHEAYVPKPWFWSDQYDVKLQIAGLNLGYDDVIVRQTGDAQSHWYYSDDRLIAVDAMNDPRNYMIGKRLIEAGKSPAKTVIQDPETDMKALLRA
ncbi:NAD(P)/FAD-dependent oxidoreductase [Pseudooctadecabacter jejudonensis]|uniref:Rhodocoxin reductase n=1 Tax=Pseudooctadecabacter jejudonensis TaxID=1391910 RepID=A0A1Y5S0H0_9RHOB|nr:FAD-dependent oxidoreductase [Pseudooctadecabacter jejudonensis]SLN29859.1 Rhodocoxin reductase [Pseudooctadecabacter jejudonensis]